MFHLFLAFVLLSPLPFGANRPWAWSLCAILFALCGLVFFMQVLLGKRPIELNIKGIWVSAVLWCIPVIWIFIQTSPFVPDSWAHPFWKLAAEHLKLSVNPMISINADASYTALMRLMSYALVFFLSLQFNRDADKASTTFKALAYAGFAYALYGVIVQLGNFNTILWFDKWSYLNNVTSTFVNRNTYGTYAGLSLLAIGPLLFNTFESSLKYGLSSHFGREYFYEQVLIKGWFQLLMAFTIISALLMSQSRGGCLSTLIAIICLIIVLLASNKIQKKSGLLALVFLMALIAWLLFANSFDVLIKRLDRLDIESVGRANVNGLLNKAAAEPGFLGLGYGTFENSFRLYRDETINGFYDKAHNTYFENVFELGWVPAIALFLSIIWMALLCLRGVWVRRKNWIYPALGFASSVLVGSHAFTDFSLQIPAVAYTYALILGVGVAQSTSPHRKKSNKTPVLLE